MTRPRKASREVNRARASEGEAGVGFMRGTLNQALADDKQKEFPDMLPFRASDKVAQASRLRVSGCVPPRDPFRLGLGGGDAARTRRRDARATLPPGMGVQA